MACTLPSPAQQPAGSIREHYTKFEYRIRRIDVGRNYQISIQVALKYLARQVAANLDDRSICLIKINKFEIGNHLLGALL